jgi:peptide/nickel transport system substrate-binding protein
MRMRRNKLVWGLTLVAILSVVPFMVGQGSAQSPKGVMKGAIHHNLSADWLDPGITSFSTTCYIPLYFFHDALLKPMPGSIYEPCLAESWTISPDFKVYAFKLRKGVKFHNGDEMTAEDVVFSFQRYKAGAAKVMKERIDKLEAVNPYLFRVTFKKPFPDFLDRLLPGTTTIAWVVPKKYIEKVGDGEYKKHPIGCGPYKFVEFTPGKRLVGEAFEGFWRKMPKTKRLEYYSVTEVSTRFAMAKTGELDWAVSMVDVYYERVKKDPALRMEMGYSPTYWTMMLAAQFDPKSPWADARVRKAASLAIDRKTLADVNQPGGGPVGTIGLPGDPETVLFAPDPYDPAQAKKLLAEAGYAGGFPGGKYYRYSGAHGQTAEQVANYWKAIGITVDTILLDSPSFISHARTGKMKGANFMEAISAPTIGARLSYMFGPQSYFGDYPETKALWAQYNQAVDPKVRKELIGQIQKIMYDQRMVLPLIMATVPTAVNSRVKGNPFKMIKPFPFWFPCPMEELELNE